jgi:outer membrane protein
MRKIIILIALFVAATAMNVNAQAPKFGHIDMQLLIQVMAERTNAMADLEKDGTDLEEMLGTMQEELQNMINDYSTKSETMSELVLQAKEEDIQMKQQRIETFRAQADQQLQQKQQELMQPILEKADSVIAEIAKEKNLIYVFDVSSRVVLYQSNQSVDVLPLVKKKMGIE